MDIREMHPIIDQVLSSKKYRSMGIPPETVADLLEKELPRHKKPKDAIRAVKAKLHNIAAPYLDTLDYDHALALVDDVFSDHATRTIKEACVEFLHVHQSTRERMPYLKDFYSAIFDAIGSYCSVLDLACGMNPFSLPLVDLPEGMSYHAYDIHAPRVQLIRKMLSGAGIVGSAEIRDILVHPPDEQATAAFLFKEAHRMEKRRSGATRDLIRSLNVDNLFISLPTHSLNGKFNLHERMSRLVDEATQGLGTIVNTIEFPSEMIIQIAMTNGKEKSE